MKIVLSGATGFLGNVLVPEILRSLNQPVVLTRDPGRVEAKYGNAVVAALWDGQNPGAWHKQVDGAGAVINLAGESIGQGRWTAKRKAEILQSRLNATRAIVRAIAAARDKPELLISGSAVGYYGALEDDPVTEERGPGSGFLSEVCKRWEAEASAAAANGVRVILLRMGVVLGRGGGALRRMLLPFRWCVGGPVGTGRQWFPWIHAEDLAGIVRFLLTRHKLNGPVNAVAPDQVRMLQFCKDLGVAMRRPCWLPVPASLLRLAFGEMSGMLLTGQRVLPDLLSRSGYSFRFPLLRDALMDVLK